MHEPKNYIQRSPIRLVGAAFVVTLLSLMYPPVSGLKIQRIQNLDLPIKLSHRLMIVSY